MERLICNTGGHNKYYEFHTIRSNGRITVKGLYGAIGQAPKEAFVYDGDSESEAMKELTKKRNEKFKKGYILASIELDRKPTQKKTVTAP